MKTRPPPSISRSLPTPSIIRIIKRQIQPHPFLHPRRRTTTEEPTTTARRAIHARAERRQCSSFFFVVGLSPPGLPPWASSLPASAGLLVDVFLPLLLTRVPQPATCARQSDGRPFCFCSSLDLPALGVSCCRPLCGPRRVRSLHLGVLHKGLGVFGGCRCRRTCATRCCCAKKDSRRPGDEPGTDFRNAAPHKGTWLCRRLWLRGLGQDPSTAARQPKQQLALHFASHRIASPCLRRTRLASKKPLRLGALSP